MKTENYTNRSNVKIPGQQKNRRTIAIKMSKVCRKMIPVRRRDNLRCKCWPRLTSALMTYHRRRRRPQGSRDKSHERTSK